MCLNKILRIFPNLFSVYFDILQQLKIIFELTACPGAPVSPSFPGYPCEWENYKTSEIKQKHNLKRNSEKLEKGFKLKCTNTQKKMRVEI